MSAGKALVRGLAGLAVRADDSVADVPALINYQGVLTDNTGKPADAGYYTLEFRIWDDPSSAGAEALVWGRSFPVHVVTNGVFMRQYWFMK